MLPLGKNIQRGFKTVHGRDLLHPNVCENYYANRESTTNSMEKKIIRIKLFEKFWKYFSIHVINGELHNNSSLFSGDGQYLNSQNRRLFVIFHDFGPDPNIITQNRFFSLS